MNYHFRSKIWLHAGLLIALTGILLPEILTARENDQKMEINEHQQLARDIFRELTEINTTLNRGCTKASEAMANRFRSAGFPEKDILLAGPHPDHTNLVVRYRGNGTKPPLLFIGHLDVVEALREDWSFDPFIFLEKDGKFFGRGTSDMKCEDACMVANFIRLKKEGFIADRDLILALTDDEENGNFNGIKWLVNNQRQLIDAEYCINPDGGGGEIRDGKHTVMGIQTCEKIYSDFSFEVRNPGGHSALPVSENAIYRLSQALLRLAGFNFPIMLNETTQLFFERNALMETGRVKEEMLAVSKNPPDMDAAEHLSKISPYFNSKMRTTCVATMLSGGHAENALPQTARANVNCRMLPDDNIQNVTETLKSIVADSMVHITCKYLSVVSPRSPLRKDIVDIVGKLTSDMWPGVIVTPMMSSGATDGKYLRAAGIPVFGISGMFTGDKNGVHGKDENIGVKEFYEGCEFMYRLIKSIAG